MAPVSSIYRMTIQILMNAGLDQEQPCDPCERFEYYDLRLKHATTTPVQFEELYAKRALYKAECTKKLVEQIKELEKTLGDVTKKAADIEALIEREKLKTYLGCGGVVLVAGTIIAILTNSDK